MSLDVYLEMEDQNVVSPLNIFIRENGQTRELTREEWDAKFPGKEPVTVVPGNMGDVFHQNITHNLRYMAAAAKIGEKDLYDYVWRPEEHGVEFAYQLVEPLTIGITQMRAHPAKFKALNAPNGWGTYENFVPWLERYLEACKEHPGASVRVSR